MYIQHPSTPSHSPYSSHRHTCVHYLLSLFAGKNFSPHLSLYVFTSDFHPSRFVCTKSQVAPLRSAGALPYIYICIFHLWVVTTLGHYFYLRTSLQILLIFNLPLTRSAGRLNTIILVSSFLHFHYLHFQHFRPLWGTPTPRWATVGAVVFHTILPQFYRFWHHSPRLWALVGHFTQSYACGWRSQQRGTLTNFWEVTRLCCPILAEF